MASRIRCASPPDSVAAARFIDRYPTPTLSRNRSRSEISRSTSRAMRWSCSDSSSCSTHSSARRADSAVNSWIAVPEISTARDSGRSRAPLQSGHGRSVMYSSIFSRASSDSVSR